VRHSLNPTLKSNCNLAQEVSQAGIQATEAAFGYSFSSILDDAKEPAFTDDPFDSLEPLPSLTSLPSLEWPLVNLLGAQLQFLVLVTQNITVILLYNPTLKEPRPRKRRRTAGFCIRFMCKKMHSAKRVSFTFQTFLLKGPHPVRSSLKITVQIFLRTITQ
jgi:hypothetical protein